MAGIAVPTGVFMLTVIMMTWNAAEPVKALDAAAASMEVNTLVNRIIVSREHDLQEGIRSKCPLGQLCHGFPGTLTDFDSAFYSKESASVQKHNVRKIKGDKVLVARLKRAATSPAGTEDNNSTLVDRASRRKSRRKMCRDVRKLRKLTRKLKKLQRKNKVNKELMEMWLKRSTALKQIGKRSKCRRRNRKKGRRGRRKLKRRKYRKRTELRQNKQDNVFNYNTFVTTTTTTTTTTATTTTNDNANSLDSSERHDTRTSKIDSTQKTAAYRTDPTSDILESVGNENKGLGTKDILRKLDRMSNTTTRRLGLSEDVEQELETTTRQMVPKMPETILGMTSEGGGVSAPGRRLTRGEASTHETKFDVIEITKLFRHTLVMKPKGGQTVDLDNYIKAYQQMVTVFDFFGPLLSFAKTDLVNKIGILGKLRSSSIHGSNPQSYKTFDNMFEYEFKIGIGQPGGNATSGVRENAWIHRPLKFILLTIGALVDDKDTKPLSSRASEFYDETMASHHSWVVRVGVHTALYSFPSRDGLLNNMNVPNDAEGMRTLSEMVDSLKDVYNANQLLYERYAQMK